MLLTTKLNLPEPKHQLLQRKKLVDLVNNHLDRRLVLVTGDAGYGKTTLLAQVIRTAKLPCVYCALDRGDGDPAVLAEHLLYGLGRLQAGLGGRTGKLLSQGTGGGRDHEVLFGTLINELAEERREELFIVMDDYHSLSENAATHLALDYFIDHLPERVRVLLASRYEPPLPSLAKWRARGEVYELGRESLRFSEDEVERLLGEVCGFKLAASEVRQVSKQTEGWITGIRLIIHNAEREGKTVKETLNGYLEANRPLFDYFAQEILNREEPMVRELLINGSLFDPLTPGLCDAVLGVKKGSGVLKDLERRHVFVERTGPETYHCQGLFRAFLQTRIGDGSEAANLRRKAAEFYQAQGQTEQAIEQLLAVGEHGQAADLIAGIGESLLDNARSATLESWLRRLPQELVENNVQVGLQRLMQLREQAQWQPAEELALRLERRLADRPDRWLLTQVLNNHALVLWYKARYQEALQLLRRALRLCPAGPGAGKEARQLYSTLLNNTGLALMQLERYSSAERLFRRSLAVTAGIPGQRYSSACHSNLGTLLMYRGEYQRAYEVYRKMVKSIGPDYIFRVGISLAQAMRCGIEAGRIGWARTMYEQGEQVCRPYNDLWSESSLVRHRGLLRIAEGDLAGAEADLSQTREQNARLGWGSVEIAVMIELARLYRFSGRYKEAARLLAEAQAWPERKSHRTTAALHIERGLLQVATGRWAGAESDLRAGRRIANKLRWKTGELQVLLGQTVLAFGRHRTERAFVLLRRAVRLCRQKGMDGILVRELQHLPGLAETARRSLKAKHALGGADRSYFNAKLQEAGNVPAQTGVGGKKILIRLFGDLQVAAAPQPAQPGKVWKSTKAVLAYFLLNPGRSFSWDEVAVWAWPDSPKARAHQMFRNTLSIIRRSVPALHEAITYHDGRYILDPVFAGLTDVDRFRELAERGLASTDIRERVSILEEAAGLCTAPLLQGLDYQWIIEQRSALEGTYLNVLKTLAKNQAETGDHEAGLKTCNLALEVDDLDEEVHLMVIAGYLALGRKQMALKHFASLERRMKKVLGAKPSEKIRELITGAG